MLSQFAIIPRVFSPAHATSPNALDSGIGSLNDLCRAEGLFLDLRNGGWSGLLGTLNDRSKAFLKFAKNRNRIIAIEGKLKTDPTEDEEWLWEAQAVNEKGRCRAIVTDEALAVDNGQDPAVTSIERLNRTTWWVERSPAAEISRTTKDYVETLRPILRQARLLMFIDPYVDPLAENYKEFPQLLFAAGTQDYKPRIEIHRASWRKDAAGKKVPQGLGAWKADFTEWDKQLEAAGIAGDVFIWPDVHDRYLVTDIISISVPNGFDIATKAHAPTRWSRLMQLDQERLQKEYDINCRVHGNAGCFVIGKIP
jgi:hypothetical protein